MSISSRSGRQNLIVICPHGSKKKVSTRSDQLLDKDSNMLPRDERLLKVNKMKRSTAARHWPP